MATYQVETDGGTYQVDTEEQPGMVESGLRGAANNFPLMPQAIAGGEALLGDKGYSENLADWNKKAAEAKAAHPIAYGAGAVGGALAPLAIPGVGGLLESAPIAGNAVLGAANAISNTDLSKDPTGALKQAAKGAGLGAATSYGIGKIFPKASSLESLADKKAVENVGISPKYLKALTPEENEALGPAIRDMGLVGTDKEALLKAALSKQNEIGTKIGSIGEQLDQLGIKPSEDAILAAVDKLQGEAAKTATLENPELRKLAIWHNKGANDIFNKVGDNPSWQTIQQLKNAYGHAAFSPTGEVKNEASKNVYFTLRDMLKNLTEKAQSNPELAQEYKDALSSYHRMDPIVEGLSEAVGRERAGIAGHGAGHGFLPRIIRSLPGQHDPAINLGTAAAATMVAPHLGPVMALPTLTNPAVQSKAASAIANNLPGIRQGATQELLDFLESKYGRTPRGKEE